MISPHSVGCVAIADMFSDFQTETTSEQITVLLICDQPEVANHFSQLWESKNVAVEVILLKDVEKTLLDPSKTWYKIFWWVGTEDVRAAQLSQLLKLLKNRTELGYVLMPQPVTEGSAIKKRQLEQTREIFTAIEQRNPYLSIFAYQDLIDATLFSPMLAQVQFSLEHTLVLEHDFHPLLLPDLITSMVEQSVVPRGGQRKVFRGKKSVTHGQIVRAYLRQHTLDPKFSKQTNPLLTPLGEWRSVKVESSVELTQILKLLQQPAPPSQPDRSAAAESGLPKPKPSLKKAAPLTPSNIPPRPTASAIVEKKTDAKPASNQKIKEDISSISIHAQTLSVEEFSPSASPFRLKKQIVIPKVDPPVIRRSRLVLESLSFSQSRVEPPVPKKEAPAPVKKIEPTTQAPQPEIKPEKVQEIDYKISNLFAGVVPEVKDVSPKVAKRPLKKKQSFRFTKRLKIATAVAAVPLVASVIYLGNLWLLERLAMSVSANMVQSQSSGSRQLQALAWSATALQTQAQWYQVILPDQMVATHQFSAIAATRLAQIAKLSQEIETTLSLATAQIFSQVEGDPFATLGPAKTQAEELYRVTGDLEAELKNYTQETEVSAEQRELINQLRASKKQLLVVQQLLAQIDVLLAKEGTATYVVLLQDNNELRPSGGFIQSVALVTFNNGKIGPITYQRTDAVSEEVQALLAAPSDLKAQLSETTLFLHDANWYTDFSESGDKVRWFFEKATGLPIQGVLAVNSTVLQELLPIVGEVKVGESGQTITEQNVQDQFVTHARESVEITTSDDFFTQAFKQVFAKVQQLDQAQYPDVFTALQQLAEQGEILVAMQSPALQTTIRTLGWSGEVIQPPCPAQFSGSVCTVSTLYQIDTNIGVNKVNKFVKKKHEHIVKFELDQTIHNHYLTYENSIKSEVWPGGKFNNYLRFALPKSVQITSVKINNDPILLENVKTMQRDEFTELGFAVTVPIQSLTKVEIEYHEPKVETGEAYAFFWQRQAGSGNTPFTLTFKTSPELIPSLVAPEATINNDEVVFRFAGNQHVFAGVKFR